MGDQAGASVVAPSIVAPLTTVYGVIMYKNEVLCYVHNYFGTSAEENIVAAMTSFFTVDELSRAKYSLFDILKQSSLQGVQGVPDYVKRQGNGRRKVDSYDIYNLYKFLDTKKFEFPEFVAKNIRRIPTVSRSEIDICAVAMNLEKLCSRMDDIESKMKVVCTGPIASVCRRGINGL